MRSAAAASDLTARSRIRDAALLRFALEGFGASVRAIAADADVSPGLVLHHFGSKGGLRAECDAHVLGLIRDAKRDVLARESGPGSFLAAVASKDELVPLLGYVLRSLQAGGPVAREFVDRMVADAAQYTRDGVAAGHIVPSRDEAARARYLTMASLGALLAELALSPTVTLDDLSTLVTTYFDRIALPALELYTEGFLTTRRMLDEYLMYVPDPPAQPAATPGT